MTRIAIPEGALFGLANLLYGVFSAPGTPPRVGVRLADSVVDLTPRPSTANPGFSWRTATR